MEPWQSWAAFVLLGGSAGYYYYATQKGKKTIKGQLPPITEKPRRKKLDTDTAAGSGSDRTTGKKERRRKTSPAGSLKVEAPAQWVGSEDDRAQEDQQNRDFARAMAGIKAGPRSSEGKPQPRAAVAPLPLQHSPSTASSATGAEADDDLSSAGSPALRPAGDISDMLEAPTPSASVLRLTEPEKPLQRRSQPEKTFQVQETKKQRQNRKKAEEKKLQREAEEDDRRKKMEQHLRAARQANNSGAQARTDAATTAATNAWTKPRNTTSGASTPKPQPAAGQSSDTYDELIAREAADPHHHGVPGHHGSDHVVKVTPVDAGAAQTNLLLDAFDTNTPIPDKKAASSSGGKSTWEKDLPSEEEQIRMIDEQNGWSTVETKKSKGGTKRASEAKSSNESSSNEKFKSESKFSKLKDFVSGH